MKFIFFSILAIATCHVNAQSVVLDPTFGNSGIAVTPNTTEISKIAYTNNGDIISVGVGAQGGGIYRVTLTKHDQNGQIDPGFGTGGIVSTQVDYSENPIAITIQPDDKILVAGAYYTGPGPTGPGPYHGFVIRYNADGTLDTGFGNNGILKLVYAPDGEKDAILVLQNGQIMIGGSSNGVDLTLTKLNSDGTFDTSFGTNGVLVYYNWNFIFWDFIQLSDDNLLCFGYDDSMGNSKMSAIKLDLQGQPVLSFGVNGRANVDTHNSMPMVNELFSSAVETSSGQIILGGHALGQYLVKLNSDGTLDANFGTAGTVNHSYPNKKILLQSDGKILVGGSINLTSSYGYALTRLDSNGVLDSSFNGTGQYTLNLTLNENDYLQDFHFQTGEDSIILAGSGKTTGTTNFTLARIVLDQGLYADDLHTSNDLMIFPNPAKDQVFLNTLNTDDIVTQISILDNTGRLIKRIDGFGIKSIELNIPAGTYYLQVQTQEGKKMIKPLIKQ